MSSKKIICLLICLVFTLSIVGCGKNEPAKSPAPDDSKVYTFKLGHVMTTKHPYHVAGEYLAKLVSERTNGKVQIQVFPSSQLGGERELYEGAQMGTVDMVIGATAPLVNFDPGFLIFDLPFLFDDKAHAHRALDGDFGKAKLKGLEKFGMVGLEYFENGYFDILQAKRPVTKAEDMKGLTIRCMENPIYMAYLRQMGANPVPMAWNEVPNAIQNGTIDGTCLTIPGTYDLGMFKGMYFTQGNITYTPVPLVISKKAWDSLPEKYRDIIRKAATETRDYQRKWIADNEQKTLDEMTKAGMTITKADRAGWVKMVVDPVYKKFVPSKISAQDVEAVNSYKKK